MARPRKQPKSPQPGQEPGEPTSDGLNPLEHGHVAGQEIEAEEEPEGQEDQSGSASTPSLASVQAQMLSMEQRHSEEVAALRRQLPPTTPKAPVETSLEDDNIDDLLFTNPKEAIKKIKESIGQDIEARLTKKYSQAENTRKFWESFNKQFPDLEGDRDIVELTMNSNLDKIANIPVDKAMEKIAELTRDRIRRYTALRPKPKKAFAEGSGSPLPKPQQEEAPAVVSIGDLIKRRRANRHSAA